MISYLSSCLGSCPIAQVHSVHVHVLAVADGVDTNYDTIDQEIFIV